MHWWAFLAIACGFVLAGCSSREAVAPVPTPYPAIPYSELTCPITRPGAPFVPPPPYPAEPPAYYRSAWYGTADLWTMLGPDGGASGGKTFWWSTAYTRNTSVDGPLWQAAGHSAAISGWEQPAITVTGYRLDDPTVTFTAGNPGTNAMADFGLAMLVGVDVPTPGCWEIRAAYKGAELAYVVWVGGP